MRAKKWMLIEKATIDILEKHVTLNQWWVNAASWASIKRALVQRLVVKRLSILSKIEHYSPAAKSLILL